MGTPTADLIFARGQMALSLAFHIVFAAVGVALPALMVVAEVRYRRTGDEVYLELARRWAKGTAILFAVGAVSGTVLSFELGLLWPRFMAFAGAIIGMPFSLGGLRLLHRGDLPRHLSLRLGAGVAADAPPVGRGRDGERRASPRCSWCWPTPG